MDLATYKAWYKERYSHEPSIINMVESFLRLHPRQEPEPTPEEFFAEPEPELPKFKLVQ